MWKKYRDRLIAHPAGNELLVGGLAPSVGDLVRLPTLADSLGTIRNEGSDALYTGSLADKIVRTIEELGGAVTSEDLATYEPEWADPIDETYGSYRVYQCPPNGQGVVSLLALRALAERRSADAPYPCRHERIRQRSALRRFRRVRLRRPALGRGRVFGVRQGHRSRKRIRSRDQGGVPADPRSRGGGNKYGRPMRLAARRITDDMVARRQKAEC